MAKAILGRKLGMTQIFAEDGEALPVTLLEAGPCVVVQRRPRANDPSVVGVQLGFDEIPEEKRRRLLNKPMEGHFKQAGVSPQRHLREFRLVDTEDFAVGKEVRADIFAVGDKVDVSGTSKGKGFAGAMKRHGFHGGPASHGSMSHRRPASSGSTDAARVFKGTKKPGHMGAVRRTVKGLTIVRVETEKNLVLVKGAVPGPKGGLVEITQLASAGG
ncbi:MAG: 50S ribosomal protein L3 [Armatimonadetes bacterium]|nr:50S ribosomal protein L3 [Armatimonadota bacterium]NIM24253.1 50S ribosomal protein L3 [Armatimonadota bacterium]NIM68122.1 50S ribosomal protein L3 [Armatimonadota bacterium]NIM76584.1 50S ribosomal protein L3 [Armatimonadota bacterium]NIN06327.1 50S ribosomal protein L3 [Armatimonadota bacterium]